jgi:hypothetical protein
MVAPGTYTVRLTVGDRAEETPLEIKADPRVDTSEEAYQAQVAMLLEARDLLSEVGEGVNTIRSVRREIDDTVRRYKKAKAGEKRDGPPTAVATDDEARAHDGNGAESRARMSDLAEHGHNGAHAQPRTPDADRSDDAEPSAEDENDQATLPGEAKRIKKALTEIEQTLIQTKSKSPQDPLNYPVMLNDKIAALMLTVESSYPPTEQSRQVLEKLAAIAHEKLDALDTLLEEDVAAFNDLALRLRVPSVVVPRDEDDEVSEAGEEDAADAR